MNTLKKSVLATILALCSNVASAATVIELPFSLNQSIVAPRNEGPLLPVYGESGYVGDELTGYILSIDALAGGDMAAQAERSENGDGSLARNPQTADATLSPDAKGAVRNAAMQFASMSVGGLAGGGDASGKTTEGASVELPKDKTGRQTLDFDDQPLRLNDGVSTMKVGPAIITNLSGGDLFIYHSGYYGMPEGGGFCALDVDFSCTGDISIVFDEPITDLIFSGYFAASTDAVYLEVYYGTELIYESLYTGNDIDGIILFDLTGLTLTSIFLYDASSLETGGIAYGGFEFDYASEAKPVAAVPLPASALLLLGSLVVLLPARMSNRRRRQKRFVDR